LELFFGKFFYFFDQSEIVIPTNHIKEDWRASLLLHSGKNAISSHIFELNNIMESFKEMLARRERKGEDVKLDDISDELSSIIGSYCITNDGIKGYSQTPESVEKWYTDYKSQGCGYCGYVNCLMWSSSIVPIFDHNTPTPKKVRFCYPNNCEDKFNEIWDLYNNDSELDKDDTIDTSD
jgi:hypothetical protein